MTTRSIFRSLKLTGLLSLLMLALFTPPTTAQEPAPFDPRFGIVDSYVNIDEANAAGAGWTRIIFRWDVVQPAGPGDWKPANVPDTFIDSEIAAGREVVAVLIGTPAWATDSNTSTAVPPIEYWGDFVYKIAGQYKGRINHWVIWNQPDVMDPNSPSHTWDGSEAEYFQLLKEAYLKIKSIDPAMQVHIGGLTYTYDFNRNQQQYLTRLLDIITTDPQAANENYYFDAVTYHVYYSPRQILDIVTDVRNILNTYGLGHKPIWINETNAPPSEDYIEQVAVAPPFRITLEEQSAFVIQAFALGLAGGAERMAFFKMRNETADVPYGLLRSDNSRRPAFNAFKVVTKYFAGTQNATWQQLGDVYIVTLDRGGQTTTVLWNATTAPTNFRLNAIAPQGVLIDERGTEQFIAAEGGVYTVPLPGAFCSNKPNCFIGGAPRVIVENGSPAQRAVQQAAVEATATPLPLPTSTPVEEATPTATPLPPPPTLTPTSIPAGIMPSPVVTETFVEQTTPLTSTNGEPVAISALPAPGVDETDLSGNEEQMPADITPVPPVSFGTVMTPRRILWLFIIGLIVFTVSYGVQVVVWYRFKR